MTLPPPTSLMAARLESSMMGESALIDRETGRVLWEGGSSSTLTASVQPRMNQLGVAHVKGTILSCILLLALVGYLSSWIRTMVRSSSSPFVRPDRSIWMASLLFLLDWTIFQVPVFDTWFVSFVYILYLVEAYCCSTRRYLANAVTIEGIETYIEQLRNSTAQVRWKVRCYHYEKSKMAAFVPVMLRRLRRSSAEDSFDASGLSNAPMLVRRKVVSSSATGCYDGQRSVDKTIAGIWKRAPLVSDEESIAPFTKITISKLVVLANGKAREDYLKKQGEFVVAYGQGDEFAEFATSLEMPGFKPRVLAVRPVEGVPSTKLFRLHLFWIFTILGLSVPFRVWFSNHCDEIQVRIVKELWAEPESSGRSWFSTSKNDPVTQHETSFRSAMQSLRLYTNNVSPASQQENATAAMMEDLSVASYGDAIMSESKLIGEDTKEANETIKESTNIPDEETTSNGGLSEDAIAYSNEKESG